MFCFARTKRLPGKQRQPVSSSSLEVAVEPLYRCSESPVVLEFTRRSMCNNCTIVNGSAASARFACIMRFSCVLREESSCFRILLGHSLQYRLGTPILSRKSVSPGHFSELHYGSLALRPADLFAFLTESPDLHPAMEDFFYRAQTGLKPSTRSRLSWGSCVQERRTAGPSASLGMTSGAALTGKLASG